MTPQKLLARIVALFPEFAAYWDNPGNCFRYDDGSFTVHGAFALFSHYFRDNYEQFSDSQIINLAQLLHSCMPEGNEGDAGLFDAAASCFLENVSGERFSKELKAHLRGEPLKIYSNWSNPG